VTTAAAANAQGAAGYSAAGDDSPIENGALSALGSVIGGLRVDASLNTLYDSNMLRLGKGFTGPGVDTSDFRFSPAATVSYGSALGRQRVFLSGTIGRDIYTRNSNRNRNYYSANGGLNWQLGSRCSGDVTGSYSSRQQLFSELSAATKNVQETVAFGGSAMCRTATGLGFGGAIHRNTTRNDSAERMPFDTDSTSFSPQLTYGTPVLGQFSLSGSLNKISYPQRPVFTAPNVSEKDGVDILSGRFGYQRGLGGRLSVNFGISYFNVKPKPTDILLLVPISPGTAIYIPQTRESNSNLGYDVGMSYNSGSRLTADVSARKSAQASINVGAQYQVVQSIIGNIGYRLNRALSLNTGVSYTQRDYRNSFSSLPEPQRRIQDKISRVFAGVSYSPSSLYSVSGELSYQDRKSNPDIYSYNSVAAVLRLRVGFGGRG
jgi:hypothetical protein